MSLPNLIEKAEATVWHGTDVYCLARVLGKNSSHNMVPVVPADFDSPGEISYLIELAGEEVDSGTLTPASVILATLSRGSIWTVDNVGFNFIAMFENTLFDEQEAEYTINVKFKTMTGVVAKAKFIITTNAAVTESTPP